MGFKKMIFERKWYVLPYDGLYPQWMQKANEHINGWELYRWKWRAMLRAHKLADTVTGTAWEVCRRDDCGCFYDSVIVMTDETLNECCDPKKIEGLYEL